MSGFLNVSTVRNLVIFKSGLLQLVQSITICLEQVANLGHLILILSCCDVSVSRRDRTACCGLCVFGCVYNDIKVPTNLLEISMNSEYMKIICSLFILMYTSR